MAHIKVERRSMRPEEWTDFQNFHVVNLCNPALNGIRTASERPLNGILSGSGGTPQER